MVVRVANDVIARAQALQDAYLNLSLYPQLTGRTEGKCGSESGVR